MVILGYQVSASSQNRKSVTQFYIYTSVSIFSTKHIIIHLFCLVACLFYCHFARSYLILNVTVRHTHSEETAVYHA